MHWNDSLEVTLRLMIHKANCEQYCRSNFFLQYFLGNFPLRMGNTFQSKLKLSINHLFQLS